MSTATEWPRAEVLLSAEGHAHVIFEGIEADLSKSTPKEARAAVVTHLSHRARTLGHPISTTITEPAGSWRIAVYPDGTIITEGALTPTPTPAQTRVRPSVTTRSSSPPPVRRRQRAAPALESDTPATAGSSVWMIEPGRSSLYGRAWSGGARSALRARATGVAQLASQDLPLRGGRGGGQRLPRVPRGPRRADGRGRPPP